MANISIIDKYSQRVVPLPMQIVLTAGLVTQPVQVPSAYSPGEKLGMIIQRIRYQIEQPWALDADRDLIRFGFTMLNVQPLASFWLGSSGIIDFCQVQTRLIGLAGLVQIECEKVEHDFTALTGGGVLCHPASLYFWGSNISAADLDEDVYINAEIMYHLISMSPEDWQEMWQLGFVTQTT